MGARKTCFDSETIILTERTLGLSSCHSDTASRRMSAEEVLQSIMDSDSDDWSCDSEGDDDSDADIAVCDRDGTNFADESAVVDVVPTAVVALDGPEDIGDVDVEFEQTAGQQVGLR
eukprot:scpid91747/ scgid10584/ 